MINILKNRKIRLFMAFFSLFLLFDMVQDSYAKYVSSATASSNMTIARWAFLVNDQDVLSNSDFSSTIVPVFPGNSYVATGYIAPDAEGYFEIEIDSSDVDVSFIETITLSLSSTNTVTDLEVYGYSLNGGSIVYFNNDPTVITSNHALHEQNTLNTYTIYVRWKEGTGELMDNEDDTDATLHGVAAVDINVNFLQTVPAPSSQPAAPSSEPPAPSSQPSPEPEP